MVFSFVARPIGISIAGDGGQRHGVEDDVKASVCVFLVKKSYIAFSVKYHGRIARCRSRNLIFAPSIHLAIGRSIGFGQFLVVNAYKLTVGRRSRRL